MTGTTYFCTDSHGNVYRRFSNGHTVPQYVAATIMRRGGTTNAVSKGNVAYSRNPGRARDMASRENGVQHPELSYSPETGTVRTGAFWTMEAECVAVRAYPGNRKTEPTV